MPICRIMIGLPASGKDTYCNELRPLGWVINSSDDIRAELYGDANDQTHNGEIFNTMFRRTVAALSNNMDVVYNATNLSAKRRAGLITTLKTCKAVPVDTKYEAIVMATPYEECIKRNFVRERVVPAYVMSSMLKRFQMPAKWEGFDEIKVYGNDNPNNVKELLKIRSLCDRTNHDNHNHTLTVGHHMRKAHKLYNEIEVSKNYSVSQAILYHDIAKPYCKTFLNSHGEPTDEAHYYGHEYASAYIFLSLAAVANINGILRPCDELTVHLIQNHMAYFGGETALNKIRERYGEDFVKKLDIVHKFDLLAH